MIISEEKDGGLLIYDNHTPIGNLGVEELQRMIDYYVNLINTLKENNNNIVEGKFASSGTANKEPRGGAGFFYDGTIKYGTYSYNGEKKTHKLTNDEIKEISSRLRQVEAKLRKKQFIKESLEKLNPFNSKKK